MTGGDWRLKAACRDADPELAFASDNSREAKVFISTFCRKPCPVVRECLGFALRTEGQSIAQRFGVYGGLTGSERIRASRRGLRSCVLCGGAFAPVKADHVRCRACREEPHPRQVGPVREHGTPAGRNRHQRLGERPCFACRLAKWESDKRRRGAA